MRILCSLVLCLSVVALPAVGAEGKKPATNAEKIVGKWANLQVLGETFEFTKDGKLKATLRAPGTDKPLTIEGTYKVEADKLTITTKGADGKETTETVKIKELTDKKLVAEDDKGRILELKKVK